MLIERCGSTVSAWRSILDADGNGRLSFNEFCAGCRALSFNGNIKDLWVQLNGDVVGSVTLKALDREAENCLAALRDVLLQNYECLLDAWQHCLDEAGNIMIDEAQFTERLATLGFDLGPAKMQKLFRCLMPDKAIRHLHMEDLQALLIGVPQSEQRLVWLGPKKPPAPVGVKKDLLSRKQKAHASALRSSKVPALPVAS